MLSIIGIIVVFVMVFGGYVLAGGKFGVILHALPYEMTMIGGAVVGSFLIGNKGVVAKKLLKDFATPFKSPKWSKKDYQDILTLLFQIAKLIRTKGVLEIESHIEKPEESPLFSKYPKIMHDHFAIDLICDTLRLMTMDFNNPYHVETNIQNQIDKHHHEATSSGRAFQSIADGLPAIGIVAAVLGVIKTMASISEPPEVLGGMIGGALVGTFLGVFLAYCFVGPFATKITEIADEEGQIYLIIRDVFIAHMQGNAPQISIEIGRGNVPSHLQPTFYELENAINNIDAPAPAAS
ncbi:MAG: flagellar motor stator protein MotA [Alphaproteobacteria bacterium]